MVRDVRPASAETGPVDTILESFPPGAGHQVMSPETAAAVRSLMVDAVQGPLGQAYAGSANVVHYGISGVDTAGKTGTAQRGGDLPPHSWFIGFVPAGPDETPGIAIAVIVEGAGPGSVTAAPIAGRIMAEWLRLVGGG
jgi:peptidoglycan glycosyltransferase